MDVLSNYQEKFEVLGLKVFQKAKRWEITIRLKKLISTSELKGIENTIASHYQLSNVKINIADLDAKSNEEALTQVQFDEIKALILNENPSFIGFLKDCPVELDHKQVYIQVATKIIADFLLVRKCDAVFEKYIYQYLHKNVKVFIRYASENAEHEEHYQAITSEEKIIISNAVKKTNSKEGVKKTSEKTSNTIMGKSFFDQPIKISEIAEDSGRVAVEGSIFKVEVKNINNGKAIISFYITDYSSSITVKLFIKEESSKDKLIEGLQEGKHIKLKGDVQYDTYLKELVIYPMHIIETEKTMRTDNAEFKRVELHAHTGMSSMDGITPAKELIKRAKAWGHKAIAITDHGVVQAFPEAYEASKKYGIKVIYGVEGYFINDGIPIVYNSSDAAFNNEFVVFDIETTGLSANKDRITEIGAVKIKDGNVIDTFSQLINPEIDIPLKITELTGITNEMVVNEPSINIVLPEFIKFVGNAPLVAHNALFDWGFIKVNAGALGLKLNNSVIDTLQLSRLLLPKLKKHKLNIICEHLNVKLENHHRASDDALATAHIFMKFLEMLKEQDIDNINDINSKVSKVNSNYKKAESHHIIILVKNEIGLKNLYKLISISHLDYFYKKPRILKSVLLQYREGLVIGSACEAGEIFRSILNNSDDDTVMELAKFYDYLELQPDGNNAFLLRNGHLATKEDLHNINKKIIDIAEKLHKPVVATGDVHFLEPEDEVFRRILMAGQGFSDADEQAPLFYKTTDEMLEDFSYLGEQRARQIVIDNPNKLIDEISDIKPIPDETFPPIIEGSEQQIKDMTMKKAHEIYGEVLPDIVTKRLEKELNSIINNGYAVMYLIAQKLVTKSLRDGYLVGSRGSVGSSFVATMCDITEVNPLVPHYICPECKHSEFIEDGSIGSGADLPDKLCPNCQKPYRKDGYDIPFEVFLGFDGDKEPDIDLNFAGEYQPEAHKYTEELFGKGYVFRAGTIGTLADKTAYGFVKKYFDDKNLKLNNAEAARLVIGCTGIKRTTGQHPGGVMIVPDYKDIYEFTPIQHPADDTSSNIITTHFDYHSISGRLLKLDILGHDGPTIIKMLEDMTGLKVNNIHLDDQKTMSLFTSSEALGISLDEIDCKVGSLGIPEFGTKFVRQMLMDTKPTTFAELVRIAGLSHGTDVWLNNAQELVRNGTTVLKDVISTRDDIIVYLTFQGVKPKTAFNIMENVRKGKGLKPEFEEAMRERNVPEWYIDSCKKIKYMFPKAHAAAYVMMSFRVAYYKVFYPEAFYATYFTAKIDDFDADLLVKGKEVVLAKLKEIDKLGNNASTKEKNLMTLLEVVFEMYQRNIKLLPVDLYQSDAVKFKLTKEGILPPLNALQGVGINAALSISKTREETAFLSIDEIRERAKVSKTVIDILKSHGCLRDLPENNQLSLFTN